MSEPVIGHYASHGVIAGRPGREELVRRVLAAHPDWGRAKVAKETGLPHTTVQRFLKKIRKGKPSASPLPSAAPLEGRPTETFEENGETAVATTLNPKIKTLEQLLAHMKVDLGIWEVEKYVINKWEVAMREPATTVGGAGAAAVISTSESGAKATLWTRGSNQPLHENLFQVKAWLKRKAPEVRAIETLLQAVEAKRLALPRAIVKDRRGLGVKRSLEVCLMDAHVGLLCQAPEADSEWDIEMAASTVMTGLEDLIATANVYGPFTEVFMPFGNDFTHSDNVFHTTTAGTPQPESISWHRVYVAAEKLAIAIVERLRRIGGVTKIYQIPGNHSRMADFTLGRLLGAWFRSADDVVIHADASPYKFHRCGVNLIGYEHGHSVKIGELPGLMANECARNGWSETHYREWHLGDQHRKASAVFEKQGVSVEYVPGITAGNEWHRLKAFNHQQRGAMAYVWDWERGPIARFQHNISQYTHRAMGERRRG